MVGISRLIASTTSVPGYWVKAPRLGFQHLSMTCWLDGITLGGPALDVARPRDSARSPSRDRAVESCDFAAFDRSFISGLARQWVRPGPV
jgi:hypothetical protein